MKSSPRRKTPRRQSSRSARPPALKTSWPNPAAKSPPGAPCSRKRAAKRRRWPAKRSLPRSASRRSRPSAPNGTAAAPARRARPRRCNSASPTHRPKRASLEDAPNEFAQKRRAVITEVEQAETQRRAAFDRAGQRREPRSPSPTRRRAPRWKPSARRATEAARAEERLEAAEPPHHRHRARNPRDAGSRAVRASRRWRRSPRAISLPDGRRNRRPKLDKLRRDRERLGAVNLRAEEELERGRDAAHRADHRARRPHGSDQAAASGHPEPEQGSARAPAGLVRGRERPLPAAVHRHCSAAARPSCN